MMKLEYSDFDVARRCGPLDVVKRCQQLHVVEIILIFLFLILLVYAGLSLVGIIN